MRWFIVEDMCGDFSKFTSEEDIKKKKLQKSDLLFEVQLVDKETLEPVNTSIDDCLAALYKVVDKGKALGMCDTEVFHIGWHVRVKDEKNSAYAVVERAACKGLHLYVLKDGCVHKGAFSWEIEPT